MFVLFFFVFRGPALYLFVFPAVDKRKLTEIAVLTSAISLSGLLVMKATGLIPKSLIFSAAIRGNLTSRYETPLRSRRKSEF
jgi:hypothetical protein